MGASGAGQLSGSRQVTETAGVLIALAVLGGLGGLLGLIGSIWFLMRLLFVLKASTTIGTVTGAEPRTSSSSDGMGSTIVYAPTVRFQTANGQQVDFVAGVATSAPPQVGRSVQVLYQKDNPQKAQIKSFVHLWLGPLVLFFVSGVLFAVSGVVAFMAYSDGMLL